MCLDERQAFFEVQPRHGVVEQGGVPDLAAQRRDEGVQGVHPETEGNVQAVSQLSLNQPEVRLAVLNDKDA